MANTLFTGKVYYRFDELPSTNDYARDLLAKSRPSEGTVIRADKQSAGRGQYGSKWLSEAGLNLTLSVIVYPNWLSATNQFRLSEATALAMLDTVDYHLNTHSRPPSTVHRILSTVKWPNDIYLGDRKTAGILIQNSIQNSHIQSSILGIGLNVNQLEFPAGLSGATSLARIAGHLFDPDAVADTLFECLEQRYLQLKAGQTEALRNAYHSNLYGLGEVRLFTRADGSTFSGTIREVQPEGQLVIDTGGQLESFAVKEVRFT